MDKREKELVSQIIIMILYHPDFPQQAKTELLNKAERVGICFTEPESEQAGD